MAKLTPGVRVEVDTQLVGVLGVGGLGRPDVEAQAGQVDRPQHMGEVGGHQGLGRGPVGGGHDRGLEPFRMVLGHAFWKNDVPVAPWGNRWSRTGRPPMAAHQRLLDGLVVVDQVELGLSPLGEEDLAGLVMRTSRPAASTTVLSSSGVLTTAPLYAGGGPPRTSSDL